MPTVFTAAALLTYCGGRALFARAPPMLPRDGRVLTILLLAVANAFFLAAAAAAVRRMPGNWSTAARAGYVAVTSGIAVALVGFVPMFCFVAVHFACYVVEVCRVFSFPERMLYVINVATTYTFVEALLVVPAVLALALWRRSSRLHES